ncbi:transporter [Pannonibacter sp. Pt2-lr]
MEYKQEVAVGKSLGAWTLGVGGYAYQQLTDDKGQNIVKATASRAFAAGPAIAWVRAGPPGGQLHAYKSLARGTGRRATTRPSVSRTPSGGRRPAVT